MIPHLASYSHTVIDSNGNKHEVGLHGLVEEGETYEDAASKVSVLVLKQTEQYVTNFDGEIQSAQTEIAELSGQINSRLESLGSFTKFAELNGMDFAPPQAPQLGEIPQSSAPGGSIEDKKAQIHHLKSQSESLRGYLESLASFEGKHNLHYHEGVGYKVEKAEEPTPVDVTTEPTEEVQENVD